jgi:hypothetical protein
MRRVALAFLFVVCAGCEEEPTPPEIGIDVSPVNLGIHSTEADGGPYQFDLQLTNNGEENLVLESVTYRGDQYCSFTFEGPDVWEMSESESAFIRGWYDPTNPGEDQIAMEVVSNASNFPTLVVPICGKAVPPGTADAGVLECEVPPTGQADCEEP